MTLGEALRFLTTGALQRLQNTLFHAAVIERPDLDARFCEGVSGCEAVGRAAGKITVRGALKCARLARQKAMMSVAVASAPHLSEIRSFTAITP
jgi:hypothetical protein